MDSEKKPVPHYTEAYCENAFGSWGGQVESTQITALLSASASGDSRANEMLYTALYQELRRLARQQMRQERGGHTLQPTALVNEAFLRLTDGKRSWENRRHFFVSAAQAMRRVLIDHARAKRAGKRGSGEASLTLLESDAPVDGIDVNILDLERAISALERINERLARVVEMRYFAGFSIEETADVLGASIATVKRDWSYARAWLIDYMGHENE